MKLLKPLQKCFPFIEIIGITKYNNVYYYFNNEPLLSILDYSDIIYINQNFNKSIGVVHFIKTNSNTLLEECYNILYKKYVK